MVSETESTGAGKPYLQHCGQRKLCSPNRHQKHPPENPSEMHTLQVGAPGRAGEAASDKPPGDSDAHSCLRSAGFSGSSVMGRRRPCSSVEDRAFQAEGQKAQDAREPGLSKETKPRPLGPEQSDGEGGRR